MLDGLPEELGPVEGEDGEGGGRRQGGPGDGRLVPALLADQGGPGEGGDLGPHKVGGQVGLQATPWQGTRVRYKYKRNMYFLDKYVY